MVDGLPHLLTPGERLLWVTEESAGVSWVPPCRWSNLPQGEALEEASAGIQAYSPDTHACLGLSARRWDYLPAA